MIHKKNLGLVLKEEKNAFLKAALKPLNLEFENLDSSIQQSRMHFFSQTEKFFAFLNIYD